MAKSGSKKWLIPLVIGLIIGGIGLTLLIKGLTTHVPEMGEAGWFEASSRRSSLIFPGIFLAFLGFLFFGAITYAVYASTPEAAAKEIAKQKEQSKRFYDALRANGVDPKTVEDEDNEYGLADLINEKIDEARPKYCQYCGNKNDPGAKKCSSCGANLSRKNK